MNYQDIEWHVETQDPERALLQEALNAAPDCRTFALTWIKRDAASMELGTGYDDDNQHSLVCIIPKLASKELAHIYVSLHELCQSYPDAKPVSSYIIGQREDYPGTIRDDKQINKRVEKLGFSYNYDLAEFLGSFDAAFEYALNYAIDDIGECRFEVKPAEEFLPEDLQESTLSCQTLGCCHLMYRNPKTGIGFGEWKYFQTD